MKRRTKKKAVPKITESYNDPTPVEPAAPVAPKETPDEEFARRYLAGEISDSLGDKPVVLVQV